MEQEEFGVSGNLRQGLRRRDSMEREERGGLGSWKKAES